MRVEKIRGCRKGPYTKDKNETAVKRRRKDLDEYCRNHRVAEDSSEKQNADRVTRRGITARRLERTKLYAAENASWHKKVRHLYGLQTSTGPRSENKKRRDSKRRAPT